MWSSLTIKCLARTQPLEVDPRYMLHIGRGVAPMVIEADFQGGGSAYILYKVLTQGYANNNCDFFCVRLNERWGGGGNVYSR